MRSFTGLSPAPRPREPAPGARHARAAADVVRAARLAAYPGAAVTVWAAGGLLHALLESRIAADQLALAALLPAGFATVALGAAFAYARRDGREARGALESASAAGALFLVLAVAGHLLHARGEPLRPLVPPAFGGIALGVGTLLLAPLLAGLLTRAAGRALDVAGASPWRVTLGHVPGDDAAPRPSAGRTARGLLGALLEGLRLPGLLLLDVAFALLARLAHRRDERTVLLHLDAEPDRLADALVGLGWSVERSRDGFAARPRDDAAPVRALPRRIHFPRCRASRVLALVGTPDDVERLRSALERPLAHEARWSWTGAARRLEARLDALGREARDAVGLEERGALLLALDDLERRLQQRPLLDDEWAALAGWKLPALRAALHEGSEGAPSERRALAPAPALAPDLARLLDAGGLAASARLLYVPYHLVPVQTDVGEVELAVDALTQTVDRARSRDVLRTLEARGAGLRMHGAHPQVARAPPATAALLGDARAAVREGRRLRTEARLDHVDLVYVPFLERDGEWVCAATGRPMPSLGEALARASAP